jgi:cob(I)alamin adenosyltransferase
MWYGSSVRRHGRSRPWRRYHVSRRRRNSRRAAVLGSGVRSRVEAISYNFSVKIYTRAGDTGETSYFDGTRVRKDDRRLDAYGEIDELNAWLGLVRASADPAVGPDVDAELALLQRDLFAVGAKLADPGERIAARVVKAAVTDADVGRLESIIDRWELELPPLRRFILAGGTRAGAALHVARTVCRRAERRMVALDPPADPIVLRYVNRLSDLLFVAARLVNHRGGAPEAEW